MAVEMGDGAEDWLTLPQDIEELSRELHDTEANLLTVDPVLAHLGSMIDSHKDASTRLALAPLARLAQERKVAVVGAHHLNKSAGTDRSHGPRRLSRSPPRLGRYCCSPVILMTPMARSGTSVRSPM